MPYEVAGNAAGIDPEALMGSNEFIDNRTLGDSRRYQSAGGGACDTVKSCLCLWFATGMLLTVIGISKLSDATVDSRGAELASWKTAMDAWTSTGEPAFRALKPVVHSNGQVEHTPPPPGPAPPTGWPTVDYEAAMNLVANAITPSSFGEDSWSDKKSETVDSVTDVWYEGTAQCPGNQPNQTCTINISTATGQTIRRTLPDGAAWQDGPHTREMQAYGCQWTDAGNPMATVGIGDCNMAGPNFGPDCADPSLLDPDHCPSDVITSGYWKQSWFGLPFFQGASKKRFTYDRDTGKCWDYTDCYCTGCGVTFKSDTTKGIGFTGYGYWTTNGGWVPFAKPMASMSGHEKAQQCQAAMLAGGITCPAESVNLVCFNAGGYPKQSCTDYCGTKGANPNYEPVGDHVEPWQHYPTPAGPPPPGPPPPPPDPPFNLQQHGTCHYDYIRTGTLSKIAMAIDSSGSLSTLGPGEWTSGSPTYKRDTWRNGASALDHLAKTLPVVLEIHSKDGPVMEGAAITHGCNMRQGKKKQCFGPTQAENFVTGITCLIFGLFLLCTPCLLFFACGNLLLKLQKKSPP